MMLFHFFSKRSQMEVLVILLLYLKAGVWEDFDETRS